MATIKKNGTTIEVYEIEIRFEFGEKSFGQGHNPKRAALDVTVLYSVDVDAGDMGEPVATAIVEGYMVKDGDAWRMVEDDEFLHHLLEMSYDPDNQELLDLIPTEDLYAA